MSEKAFSTHNVAVELYNKILFVYCYLTVSENLYFKIIKVHYQVVNIFIIDVVWCCVVVTIRVNMWGFEYLMIPQLNLTHCNIDYIYKMLTSIEVAVMTGS